MGNVRKTVDLSGIRDIDLNSITIRDINADDMLDASARCIPPDGGQLDGNLFNMSLRQQLIAQAIVEYVPRNGDKAGASVPSAGPCRESLDWSARTREFVGEVFEYVNGVSFQEREDFRKALAGPQKSTDGSPDGARAE